MRQAKMIDKIYSEMDMNKDGTITCEDAGLLRTKQFHNADIDKNNILDVNEFRKAPWGSSAFAAEYLDTFDLNNDKLVSVEEFTAKKDVRFKRMDINNDCIITHDEIEQSMPKNKGNKRRQKNGKGQGKPKRIT